MSGLSPALIANLADQCFGRMGNPFKAGKFKKTACAFNGMNKTEYVRDGRTVRRIALEMDDLRADLLQMIGRLCEKIVQQFVHERPAKRANFWRAGTITMHKKG